MVKVRFIVRDINTKAPIKDALIQLNGFKVTTDEKGVAEIEIPEGTYTIVVTAKGYEPYKIESISITEPITITVDLAPSYVFLIRF